MSAVKCGNKILTMQIYENCCFSSCWLVEKGWSEVIDIGADTLGMMITNFNLPPSIRFKKENLLRLGFVPGPSEPSDLTSFLPPFIDELHLLCKGISCYDGWRKEPFILHGACVTVCGDQPAVSKIMGLTGYNGKCTLSSL
jgi:hypothetical protein